MSAAARQMTGKCMCGASTFSAVPLSLSAGACHCTMCQKWSGGMFLAVDCGTSVAFDKAAPLSIYKGSEWAERVFCKRCGSSLVWQTQDGANQHVSISSFDDPGQFSIDSEIFIDRKPDSYALAGERKKMTEAEAFAMFGPGSEGQS